MGSPLSSNVCIPIRYGYGSHAYREICAGSGLRMPDNPRYMQLQKIVSGRSNLLALAVVLWVAGWVVMFSLATLHWPLVGDASLIHYAVFLSQHGFAPYRQIVDINMPGAYLTDSLVLRVFGGGALGWRIFDLSLFALAGVAMQSIAGPGMRWAGWAGAGVFLLLHGRDGVAQTGQRDLVVAVLLLCAYALLAHAMRDEDCSPAWLGIAGFCGMWAATIKPTALIFVLVLGAFAVHVLRGNPRKRRLYGYGGIGAAAALSLNGWYLWKWRAVHAFWLTLTVTSGRMRGSTTGR